MTTTTASGLDPADEIRRLRADLDTTTTALTQSRARAATYANEIGSLKAELERLRAGDSGVTA